MHLFWTHVQIKTDRFSPPGESESGSHLYNRRCVAPRQTENWIRFTEEEMQSGLCSLWTIILAASSSVCSVFPKEGQQWEGLAEGSTLPDLMLYLVQHGRAVYGCFAWPSNQQGTLLNAC